MSSDRERRDRFEAVAAEVYEPLQRFLRRRASADDADEVFGDVLLTIWRRLDDVPDDAPLPWSYGVARRALANKRRSGMRRLRLLERLSAQPPARHSGDPGDSLGDPDLAAAMATLPDGDRELLTLWAWEDLEPREIAVVLGTTPNAVSLRLGRARAKLAEALRRQDEPPAGHEQGGRAEEHLP